METGLKVVLVVVDDVKLVVDVTIAVGLPLTTINSLLASFVEFESGQPKSTILALIMYPSEPIIFFGVH